MAFLSFMNRLSSSQASGQDHDPGWIGITPPLGEAMSTSMPALTKA